MARSLSLVRRLSPLLPILVAGLAGAGLASGCAVSPAEQGPAVAFDPCAPVMLVPDATMTDAQQAQLAAGAALWNQSAGSDLVIAPAGDVEAGLSLPVHFQNAAAPFHGLYDAPNGQIFINDDLTDTALAITIAHEIGHSFGLVHVPLGQRPSLMNPANLTVPVTPDDIATLSGIWGHCGSLDAAGTE